MAGRRGKLEAKLRALLASAVSICGVSAAIAAAGAIGREFSLKGLKEAGWRPIALFASATVVNIVVALGLAAVLFGGFETS